MQLRLRPPPLTSASRPPALGRAASLSSNASGGLGPGAHSGEWLRSIPSLLGASGLMFSFVSCGWKTFSAAVLAAAAAALCGRIDAPLNVVVVVVLFSLMFRGPAPAGAGQSSMGTLFCTFSCSSGPLMGPSFSCSCKTVFCGVVVVSGGSVVGELVVAYNHHPLVAQWLAFCEMSGSSSGASTAALRVCARRCGAILVIAWAG